MKHLIAYLSGFAFGFAVMYLVDEVDRAKSERPRLVLVS
jgi:hypothetical protein